MSADGTTCSPSYNNFKSSRRDDTDHPFFSTSSLAINGLRPDTDANDLFVFLPPSIRQQLYCLFTTVRWAARFFHRHWLSRNHNVSRTPSPLTWSTVEFFFLYLSYIFFDHRQTTSMMAKSSTWAHSGWSQNQIFNSTHQYRQVITYCFPQSTSPFLL